MCVALVPRCDLRDLQNSGGSIETLKQFLKICSDEDSLRVSWSCDTTKNSGSPHGKAYNAPMSDELRSCVADRIVSCHCRGDRPVVGSGQTADAGAGDGATRPVAVSDARTRQTAGGQNGAGLSLCRQSSLRLHYHPPTAVVPERRRTITAAVRLDSCLCGAS